MPIGKLLKHALDLTIRYPALWLLALVGALPTTLAGLGRALASAPSFFPAEVYYANSGIVAHLLRPLANVLGNGCLLILLQLAGAVLTSITTAALIAGIEGLRQGQQVTFVASWHSGMRFWARVFGMDVLIGLPIIALAFVAVLGTTALSIQTNALRLEPMGLLCLVPVGILALAYVLASYPVLSYGYRFAVLRNRTAGQALGDGWKMLRGKLAPTLVVIVWLFLCSLPYALVYIGWDLGDIWLIGGLGGLLWNATHWADLTAIIALSVFGLICAAMALAGALWTVFGIVVWSQAFQDLAPAEETAFQF